MSGAATSGGTNEVVDAVIVGAGLAGLTAALQLKRAGRRIVLLEGRDRVGGRAWTQRNADGTYFDWGAQWIGPGHDNMYAYAKQYGISTFPTRMQGKTTIVIEGKRRTYRGVIPRLPLWSLFELYRVMKRVDRLAKSIELDTPWTSPGASRWDAVSAREWLESTTRTAAVRAIMTIALESIFAGPLMEVSMLHVLFYVKSSGSFEFLINTAHGAQQDRLDGGAQSIAEGMARDLGNDLQLCRTVRGIAQTHEGVQVMGDGFCVAAKRVIVALPPVIAASLSYSASTVSIAERRMELAASLRAPIMYKCYCTYERPFWRELGLNAMCSSAELPVSLVFDGGTRHSAKGILTGFITGERAVQLYHADPAERRAEVIRSFATYLGPEASSYLSYHDETLFDDAFTRGCYAALYPKNTYTKYATSLADPDGRIHWAGTETSPRFSGYMEGAVLSGMRAAEEVLSSNEGA